MASLTWHFFLAILQFASIAPFLLNRIYCISIPYLGYPFNGWKTFEELLLLAVVNIDYLNPKIQSPEHSQIHIFFLLIDEKFHMQSHMTVEHCSV